MASSTTFNERTFRFRTNYEKVLSTDRLTQTCCTMQRQTEVAWFFILSQSYLYIENHYFWFDIFSNFQVGRKCCIRSWCAHRFWRWKRKSSRQDPQSASLRRRCAELYSKPRAVDRNSRSRIHDKCVWNCFVARKPLHNLWLISFFHCTYVPPRVRLFGA